ncbi:MAG TPA: hypothetical protein V6C57_14885 [Coleofasciculaceae cyanobacterium]
MLKPLKTIAFLSGTLALFTPTVAWGELPATRLQFAAPPATVDDGLVCYMQTAEGATLNLNGLCGSNAANPNRQLTVSQSPHSGTLPAGLAPYSRTSNGVACVVIDQQGRPCRATQ